MICAFEVVTLLNPFLHLNYQQDAKNYWSKYFLFSQFYLVSFMTLIFSIRASKNMIEYTRLVKNCPAVSR